MATKDQVQQFKELRREAVREGIRLLVALDRGIRARIVENTTLTVSAVAYMLTSTARK